ncbi:MAG: NTP transferase domain-containing protein [Euryarchaeota archaeon]|nr:NTP transferase domain-containing protein [Euryarchaeota archaeon]
MLDALVMAGGRGERMGAGEEKPMLPLLGRPMIDYVLDALEESGCIRRVFVATSPDTRRTEEHVRERGLESVRAPGEGFVEDLRWCMENLRLGKTLVISSDLPLLSGEDIEMVVREYHGKGLPHMAVLIPAVVVAALGMDATMAEEGMVPSGINVVDGTALDVFSESRLVTSLIPFAFNVNTPGDHRKAESILSSRRDR